MNNYEHYPLEEGHFSYLAVCGDRVELKVGERQVSFNMQTAEEVATLLSSYVQDRRLRRQAAWERHSETD